MASSLVSGSVCTRMLLSPDVLTIGELAASIPSSSAVWATASRTVSTVVWFTWSEETETRYSTPPSNSMPRSSPFQTRPKTATPTMTAEMEYQSTRRPTKSIETLPS